MFYRFFSITPTVALNTYSLCDLLSYCIKLPALWMNLEVLTKIWTPLEVYTAYDCFIVISARGFEIYFIYIEGLNNFLNLGLMTAHIANKIF